MGINTPIFRTTCSFKNTLKAGYPISALDPETAKASTGDRLHLDEKTFRWMHNEDAMATEKLAEGIRKFNADARKLQEYALSQVAEKVG